MKVKGDFKPGRNGIKWCLASFSMAVSKSYFFLKFHGVIKCKNIQWFCQKALQYFVFQFTAHFHQYLLPSIFILSKWKLTNKNLGPVTENINILEEDNYEMSGGNAQIIADVSSEPRVNPELSMYPTGLLIFGF